MQKTTQELRETRSEEAGLVEGSPQVNTLFPVPPAAIRSMLTSTDDERDRSLS